MYVCLASSWNIFSGYTGYVSLGHVAFFGFGAYITAIFITKFNLSPWLSIILGGVFAMILAVGIGLLCLRIRGAYFAITTLCIAEMLKVVATNLTVFGGVEGIVVPPILSRTLAYYIALVITTLTVFSTVIISHSKLGKALICIGENEDVAEMLGVNTFRYKLLSFNISSLFPGLFGGLYILYTSYIDPPMAFTPLISFNSMLYCLFGGMGTIIGPIIGPVILAGVGEILWCYFPYVHLIILGILVVIFVIYFPGGIMEISSKIRARK
jgi:branched-chain amino acid transport system permease protein